MFAVGFLVPGTGWFLARRIFVRLNPLPLCKNKKCRSRKYHLEKEVEEGSYYRCGCGDLYLLTPDDEFKFVTPDGKAQPYRKRFSPSDSWWPAPEVFEKYRGVDRADSGDKSGRHQ